MTVVIPEDLEKLIQVNELNEANIIRIIQYSEISKFNRRIPQKTVLKRPISETFDTIMVSLPIQLIKSTDCSSLEDKKKSMEQICDFFTLF